MLMVRLKLFVWLLWVFFVVNGYLLSLAGDLANSRPNNTNSIIDHLRMLMIFRVVHRISNGATKDAHT